MTTTEPGTEGRRRRLDELAGPSWARTMATLLRAAGVALAILLLALGFFTGGFFLALTVVLAVVAVALGFLLGRMVEREAWYSRSNARAYTLALLVGFPLALVLVAQLAGPLLTPAAATSECFSGEVGRDEQRDMQLPVDPRVTRMEFRLRVPALEDGALRWWVTDPVGQVQWGGRAEEPGFTDSEQLPPQGGQWVVTVRGEAARAEYVIEWLAAVGDEPLPSGPACD